MRSVVGRGQVRKVGGGHEAGLEAKGLSGKQRYAQLKNPPILF